MNTNIGFKRFQEVLERLKYNWGLAPKPPGFNALAYETYGLKTVLRGKSRVTHDLPEHYHVSHDLMALELLPSIALSSIRYLNSIELIVKVKTKEWVTASDRRDMNCLNNLN
ncbi:MAG: hypothetical protein ABI041_20485 [Bdellovibrionia bacterium]